MKILRNTLKFWLPLAAAITLLSGLIYITLQQTARLGANEIPAGLAVDAAAALASGQPTAAVLPAGKIELAQSLSPLVIVYDKNGSPLASNAALHGSIPAVPAGVFAYVTKNGEDRITWQPEPGVRLAAVIRPVLGGPGGFVLAARSLRETESRLDLLLLQVGAGWAVTLAITLALVVLFEILPFTRIND